MPVVDKDKVPASARREALDQPIGDSPAADVIANDTTEARDKRFKAIRSRFRNSAVGADILAQPAWPACPARLDVDERDGGGELACESPRGHPDGIHNATFEYDRAGITQSEIRRWRDNASQATLEESRQRVPQPVATDRITPENPGTHDLARAEEAAERDFKAGTFDTVEHKFAAPIATNPNSFRRMTLDVPETATPLDILATVAKRMNVDLATAGLMVTPIGDMPSDAESLQAARARAYHDQSTRNMAAANVSRRKVQTLITAIVAAIVDGQAAVDRIEEVHGTKALPTDAADVTFETLAKKLRQALRDIGLDEADVPKAIFAERSVANDTPAKTAPHDEEAVPAEQPRRTKTKRTKQR